MIFLVYSLKIHIDLFADDTKIYFLTHKRVKYFFYKIIFFYNGQIHGN